jgi:hypothetical protein
MDISPVRIDDEGFPQAAPGALPNPQHGVRTRDDAADPRLELEQMARTSTLRLASSLGRRRDRGSAESVEASKSHSGWSDRAARSIDQTQHAGCVIVTTQSRPANKTAPFGLILLQSNRIMLRVAASPSQGTFMPRRSYLAQPRRQQARWPAGFLPPLAFRPV